MKGHSLRGKRQTTLRKITEIVKKILYAFIIFFLFFILLSETEHLTVEIYISYESNLSDYLTVIEKLLILAGWYVNVVA